MNKTELREKLSLLGVDENRYSLDGDLKPDSIILFQSYNNWHVFYLDERGGRNDEKVFESEENACLYVYTLFADSKKIEEQLGINT